MEGFTTYSGKIAVIADDNIDTDRIMPARFLSRVSKSGYGELLFNDVRGADFALDKAGAKDSTILVVGNNFGCGSSREHAVWALQQAGYKAVISHRKPDAPGYSDIFRQNAANCGLLLIELPTESHSKVADLGSGSEVKIDLPSQTITFDNTEVRFEINSATKHALVEGLDLIGTTLRYADQISAYEAKETVTR